MHHFQTFSASISVDAKSTARHTPQRLVPSRRTRPLYHEARDSSSCGLKKTQQARVSALFTARPALQKRGVRGVGFFPFRGTSNRLFSSRRPLHDSRRHRATPVDRVLVLLSEPRYTIATRRVTSKHCLLAKMCPRPTRRQGVYVVNLEKFSKRPTDNHTHPTTVPQ